MREILELVPYDPKWPGEFDRERRRLADRLGVRAIRIDHHGSTAVPGLAAKPIIDIQISITPLHPLDATIAALDDLGYVHVPHPDDAFCPFFHRPAEWPHTHHVHAVEAGGLEERRTLAFRDYLRRNPVVAREYEQLKRQLAARHNAGELDSYPGGKTGFVECVIRTALANGYPLDL